MRNGRRYWSTAVWTTRARWVKVAQPRPYSPGSLVSTLTTTKRMPAGAVRMVLTAEIFRDGVPALADAGSAAVAGGAERVASQGRPRAPAPRPDHLSQSRRCMGVSCVEGLREGGGPAAEGIRSRR